jgi:hypothetical protein
MLERKYVQEIVEKIKLLDYFKLPSDINGEQYRACCLTAYCILIWDIHLSSAAQKDNSKVSSLLYSATKGFVLHYLPSLYPKISDKNDPQQLKKSIESLLAKQNQQRVKIKESFTSSDDVVTFSLIAKVKGEANKPLITITGERLKPTRLRAYKQVESELVEHSL